MAIEMNMETGMRMRMTMMKEKTSERCCVEMDITDHKRQGSSKVHALSLLCFLSFRPMPCSPPPFRDTTLRWNAALANRIDRTFSLSGCCNRLSITLMSVLRHSLVLTSKLFCSNVLMEDRSESSEKDVIDDAAVLDP